MTTKYRLEKVLHELIRDLPEVAKYNSQFEKGIANTADTFQAIADAIRAEKEKAMQDTGHTA